MEPQEDPCRAVTTTRVARDKSGENPRPTLAEAIQSARDQAARKECNGECAEHTGKCRVWLVRGGYYSYCDAAVAEDRSRGFDPRLLDGTPTHPQDLFPGVHYTEYRYLPNPAKCAIEYLDAQGYGHRTLAKLDAYIDHYFTANGLVCDEATRRSARIIAVKRFSLEETP